MAIVPGHRVRIEGDYVVKSMRPDDVKFEATLTSLAHDVSRGSGLYYVPKVIEADEKKGRIVLEFLPNLQPVLKVLDTPEELNILRAVAQSLAHIHRYLTPVVRTRLELFNGRFDVGVINHGDFNLTNVCIQVPTGRVVIFDWNVPPMYRRSGLLGPPEYDVACFLRSVILSSPMRGFSVNRERRTGAVIAAYEQSSARILDRDLLSKLLRTAIRSGASRQLRQAKCWSFAKSLYALMNCGTIRSSGNVRPNTDWDCER